MQLRIEDRQREAVYGRDCGCGKPLRCSIGISFQPARWAEAPVFVVVSSSLCATKSQHLESPVRGEGGKLEDGFPHSGIGVNRLYSADRLAWGTTYGKRGLATISSQPVYDRASRSVATCGMVILRCIRTAPRRPYMTLLCGTGAPVWATRVDG